MAKPIQEMSTWEASAHPSRAFVEQNEEAWEATRQQTNVATQLMRDKDDNLVLRHVGRQITPSQWEMFVVIDPAEALQQQIDMLKPEYIALHDVGTVSSRRILSGLAAATGRPVHQLHVRRQGLGVALAKLEFIELPVAADLPPLRLYSTEIDADTQQRHRIAQVLLAHSRLAVVIAGDLPPHAMATALMPLRVAIKTGPWTNREILMLPLAGAAALASQASSLAATSEIQVRTTPLVRRPADAWNYIRGAWHKLRTQLLDTTTLLPEIIDGPAAAAAPSAAAAPTVSPSAAATPAAAGGASLLEPATPRTPLPMQPMPSVRSGAPAAATVDPALATYVRKCGELKGMVSCGVFELATQRTIAHAGGRPGPAALASQGAHLMASMAEVAHALNLGDAAPDAAVTLGKHHLLLRAVPSRPGLALHAVLDKSLSNLTLVRLQLQRLDMLLEEGDTL